MLDKYKSFEQETKFWLRELEKYNEKPFQRKPSKEDWSMAELYEYLTTNILEVYSKNIFDCMEGRAKQEGGKTFKGVLAFMFGSMMFIRKEDKKVTNEPSTLSEAKDKLLRCLKKMNEGAVLISNDSKKAETMKTEHPVYGMLNAKDWYALAERDLKAHRGLKDKIEQSLVVTSVEG